ncbi:hypothetical protein EU527_05475 [Candidatus Thorarchaeota archaeon]|nr:MAG: hypothetical protein EU527_05475 [Candidatus Thorarchaeota archaeon]
MKDLLDDPLNIELLKLVCGGEGVDINIRELSSLLGKHRNTIQSRFDKILQHEIIDPPFHPFRHLLNELPLLVVEKISLSRDPKTNLWIEIDPNIWAAFFFKEEEFNTLMIEIHKDFYDYQIWKERILNENLITSRSSTEYIPSESLYLSTKAILKYDPSSSIKVFRENFRQGIHTKINGLELDEISVDILEALLLGKGIQANPNKLAKALDIHRKTVQRRLDLLMSETIILPPVCRFPRIWTPPEYFLVLSLLEITKNKDRISKILSDDSHVSMLLRANVGRYNLLAFNSFYRMEDHLAWQEEYDQRFSNSFGAVKNYYLSPEMTFAINQQYTSLAYLNARTESLRGKELMKSMKK